MRWRLAAASPTTRFRHRPIADVRRSRHDSGVNDLRFEIAVGVAVFVMFLIGVVAGVSPQDWEFWYAIPVSVLAVGLLLGKRALFLPRRGSRFRALLLGSLAVLLVLLGLWAAWEIRAATPCRLRSDCRV